MPDPEQHRTPADERRAAADTGSRRRDLRKLRLQQVLLELLQEGRRLDEIRAAEIAERVGMGRSAVYHYIPSKSALFRAALAVHLDAHFARSAPLTISADEPLRAWVERVLEDILQLWVTSRPIMVTSAYLAAQEAEHAVWVAEQTRPWREAMQRAARAAAARGDAALPADVAGAAEAAMATVQGLCAARLGHLDVPAGPERDAVVGELRAVLVDAVSRILGAPPSSP